MASMATSVQTTERARLLGAAHKAYADLRDSAWSCQREQLALAIDASERLAVALRGMWEVADVPHAAMPDAGEGGEG